MSNTMGHHVLLGHCTNIIVVHCLVLRHERGKCKTNVRKLDRGEEKGVKKEGKKIVKRCVMTDHLSYLRLDIADSI